MQIPSTPDTVAAAMDHWEAANGTTDLYEKLVTHLGKEEADDLWTRACQVYDVGHEATRTKKVNDGEGNQPD